MSKREGANFWPTIEGKKRKSTLEAGNRTREKRRPASRGGVFSPEAKRGGRQGRGKTKSVGKKKGEPFPDQRISFPRKKGGGVPAKNPFVGGGKWGKPETPGKKIWHAKLLS